MRCQRQRRQRRLGALSVRHPQPPPPPVRVHRDTLRFVLRSLLPPPAAATPDSGAPSDGEPASDGGRAEDAGSGRGRESGRSDSGAVSAPQGGLPAAAAEGDSDPDSVVMDGDGAPEMDADDPPPAPAPADGWRRCTNAIDHHSVPRGSPQTLPRPPFVTELNRLLHRAAQHAVSSGSRPQTLEAFQAVCLLLPHSPRLIWQLAFCLCLSDLRAGRGQQLRTALGHLIRHAGLDRPAVQMTVLSALAAAGRTEEGRDMLASAAPNMHRYRSMAPPESGRLYGVMMEWARCVTAPPGGETRRRHLEALRAGLEKLVADRSLRPALEPLLRSVRAELEQLYG